MAWWPNPPTHAFGTLLLVGSQWLNVDFHSWKFTLELIIVLPKQHYNNPKHSCQVCSRWGQSVTPPHPYKPLGLWARPLPHRQVIFCLSPKGWGQVDIFPLADGARSPRQLQTTITSSYNLWCYQPTTLSTCNMCVDVDGTLACFIQASIEEVMVVQT